MTMPIPSTDPLSAYRAGAFWGLEQRPVPLIATAYDVQIAAGLAVVQTTRTFRNAEDESIEATITFPVPVSATLFELRARIGDRVLKAEAKPRVTARKTYEEAIDSGQTSVLHEEVLKGVHMLSVGHIPPETEIEISFAWTATLTVAGGKGSLRIPQTVGDIYGSSPLPDSDDLVHGGVNGTANLAVSCEDGAVSLAGQGVVHGATTVPLDAPIDLSTALWPVRRIAGETNEGREVTLEVTPQKAGDAPLYVAVLVDHSGSMASKSDYARRGISKHRAVSDGLRSAVAAMGQGDVIDLWEFDHQVSAVGLAIASADRSVQEAFAAILDRLTPPNGGTEIGGALQSVSDGSEAKDILLITDGKSHSMDIQAHARTGRRVSVVLIGEDSLEANVGHIAALTGGQVFVAAPRAVGETIVAALTSLRTPAAQNAPIDAFPPETVTALRGGAALSARWGDMVETGQRSLLARAVAAQAASLALPLAAENLATEIALAEGLVTHLTSLVLVDDVGEKQEGLPATRKVALPSPRTDGIDFMAQAAPGPLVAGAPLLHRASAAAGPFAGGDPFAAPDPFVASGAFAESDPFAPSPPPRPAPMDPQPTDDLAAVGAMIDWSMAPTKLIAGDIALLPDHVQQVLHAAASLPEIQAEARAHNLAPIVLVIGLLARYCGEQNRTAQRLAKRILGRSSWESGFETAARLLNLSLR